MFCSDLGHKKKLRFSGIRENVEYVAFAFTISRSIHIFLRKSTESKLKDLRHKTSASNRNAPESIFQLISLTRRAAWSEIFYGSDCRVKFNVSKILRRENFISSDHFANHGAIKYVPTVFLYPLEDDTSLVTDSVHE